MKKNLSITEWPLWNSPKIFQAAIAKVTETPVKITSELPPFQESYTN